MKKYENLKKVELHCHLDGSLNIDRVSRWTRKDPKEVRELLELREKGNLTHYLSKFEYPISLLQTRIRIKEAVQDLCNDMLSENVIYAEIRFDPLSHMRKNLTLDEIVKAALEGIYATDLKAKLILCMKRERTNTENKKVINIAKKYLKNGVACVDLAGDESLYPTKDFKELFEYAKEKGVPFVIHAGESGSYKDIKDAIDFGASRIGHGIQAIKNFEVMENLKRHNIPLEICVTSNMVLDTFESYTDHPISRLIDSGVPVTVNTDNRTLLNITLTDEYNYLNKFFGFTSKDFTRMNRCAIEHSFLSDEEKKELISKLR